MYYILTKKIRQNICLTELIHKKIKQLNIAIIMILKIKKMIWKNKSKNVKKNIGALTKNYGNRHEILKTYIKYKKYN